MLTQSQRIHEYLADGNVLNRLDAWDELGVVEAPARISELRKRGVPIQTRMVPVVNRYGETVRVAEWFINLAD